LYKSLRGYAILNAIGFHKRIECVLQRAAIIEQEARASATGSSFNGVLFIHSMIDIQSSPLFSFNEALLEALEEADIFLMLAPRSQAT